MNNCVIHGYCSGGWHSIYPPSCTCNEKKENIHNSYVYQSKKKPHKCPVCEGTGKVKDIFKDIIKDALHGYIDKDGKVQPENGWGFYKDCTACKGECVLWE